MHPCHTRKAHDVLESVYHAARPAATYQEYLKTKPSVMDMEGFISRQSRCRGSGHAVVTLIDKRLHASLSDGSSCNVATGSSTSGVVGSRMFTLNGVGTLALF